MIDLSATVLPLIRPRADLSRWSAANEHGRQMSEAVTILEEASETEDPAVVFAVTQKAPPRWWVLRHDPMVCDRFEAHI